MDHAWIEASTLPEKDSSNEKYYWACWNGAGRWNHDQKQGLARYIDGMGWQPLGSMGWDWNVTHWMPLPELPPKETSHVPT
jgi:hypothetical protein